MSRVELDTFINDRYAAIEDRLQVHLIPSHFCSFTIANTFDTCKVLRARTGFADRSEEAEPAPHLCREGESQFPL